ncbi:MAG TPA: hypothetical protein VKB39_11865, partial [Candidatus Baltobacteraceae bacterium]|nr:hypothetical protein [Candidatus Baltobacteraceae bacterium]
MSSLTTLLSHAYVAYTIEFDNESERRFQHRTTTGGGSGLWRHGALGLHYRRRRRDLRDRKGAARK